jgi:hypothetical protein
MPKLSCMVLKFGDLMRTLIFLLGIKLRLNKFLKRLMIRNYGTSNIMARGECGMRPLLVEIIKRVISYIKIVKSRPSAVASKSLHYEYTNDISPNITTSVDKFRLQGMPFDTAGKSKINKIRIKYEEIWKKEFFTSPKAISYILFKNRISMESYSYHIKSP